MGHFTTAGRRYREGSGFASFGALDVGVSAPTTVEQTAPASLPDGAGVTRSFLFWDTGRQITGKRHVRWSFNYPGNWATWNAIAWYGVPGRGSGGQPIQSFDAYWVGTGSVDPTPIDGPASIFVNGPAPGDIAWPWAGDNHEVRTQWGAATVRALSTLQRSAADPLLDFSSLTQLVFGGDDTDVFEENDDGVVPAGGITGLVSTTAQQLVCAQGSGGLVLAGYVVPTRRFRVPWIDKYWLPPQPIPIGDQSPEDLIRLRQIRELLDRLGSEPPLQEDTLGGLLEAAKRMTGAELQRAIVSTRGLIQRGEAALKSLEGMLQGKR